jgi:hypothetical protein
MLGRRSRSMPPEYAGRAGKNDANADPTDELMSALIVAYEQALDRGAKPAVALFAVLDWASQEIKRYSR